MRTLYVIRHAKSDWNDATLSDFDRPLNNRGKRDAPQMGKWLKKQNEIPDLIISSPAKRAKKTIEKIAEEIEYDEKNIHWEKNLYETNVKTWLTVVCAIDNKHTNVFLVGHNDTLTQFVNYVADAGIVNVPTCGVVKIEFNVSGWMEISFGTGNLIWFQSPKNI
ncbi:MAG: SixA phosphatase family protein [Flavobacteriales bacterium]